MAAALACSWCKKRRRIAMLESAWLLLWHGWQTKKVGRREQRERERGGITEQIGEKRRARRVRCIITISVAWKKKKKKKKKETTKEWEGIKETLKRKRGLCSRKRVEKGLKEVGCCVRLRANGWVGSERRGMVEEWVDR